MANTHKNLIFPKIKHNSYNNNEINPSKVYHMYRMINETVQNNNWFRYVQVNGSKMQQWPRSHRR